MPWFARLHSFFRRYHRAFGWGTIVVAVLAAVVLGSIGFQKNFHATGDTRQYSTTTLVFMSLQMLLLDKGDVPDPVGWELETARFLAVLALSGTLLKTAAILFRQQLDRFCLRLLRGHVVICGLDEKGSQLARDLLSQGMQIVVIEKNNEHRRLPETYDAGAFVIAGDAMQPVLLKRAGVERAARVFVTAGEDATNVRIAAAAGEVCRDSRRSGARPTIHVHCTDHRLFSLLERQSGEANSRSAEFRRFDVELNHARILFEEHPLDRVPIAADSPLTVQLILLGATRESECLLLQLARLGHYANRKKPRVLVVTPDAESHEQRFRFRFPRIDQCCHVEFHSRELDYAATMKDLTQWIADPDLLTTIVICPPNENQALPVGLGLPPEVAERGIPVFVQFAQQEESARLCVGEGRQLQLRPVGSLKGGSAEMVIQNDLDQLAQLIHQRYVEKRTAEGHSPAKFPAMRPWDELPESYREANRHQADHISVKLRAVRCQAIPEADRDGAEPAVWTEEEIEILAQMEHERWAANRWLEGWRQGPRDEVRKLNPTLVPWEELDEATRDYDRSAVRQIPALLRLMRRVIVRDTIASE